MKAKKIEANTFRPITLQVEITTEYELEMLKNIVDAMAPLNSTAASLNQMQYDFACKWMIMLRNAAFGNAGIEQEIK